MNFLQTLDSNLVNDMIGVRVIEIRETIKKSKLNYTEMIEEFNLLIGNKDIFIESFGGYDDGRSYNEKLEEALEYIADGINIDWEEWNDGEKNVDFEILQKLKWFWW
tara:strand:- start:901 stop:1221 length:321 start_codon:yes stop_codon:yes gene_type:complete